MGRIVALLILGLWLWPGALQAESFEDGLHAFRSGQAELAQDIWLPMAESGHAAAQYSLGKLYEQGEGSVQQDYGAAVRWYAEAAAQNLPAAQNNLGLMYAKGHGVPPDVQRALELWRSAARLDYPWAQYNLGLAHFQGKGTKSNEQAALAWIRRAADGDLAEAQFIMGLLYRDGLIVAEDRGRALSWYMRAAQQGHMRARQQVRHLQVLQFEPQPIGDPEVVPQSLASEGTVGGSQVAVSPGLLDQDDTKSPTPASDSTWNPPSPKAQQAVSQVSAQGDAKPKAAVPPPAGETTILKGAIPAASGSAKPLTLDSNAAAVQDSATPSALQPSVNQLAAVAPAASQVASVGSTEVAPQGAVLDEVPQPILKPKAILESKVKSAVPAPKVAKAKTQVAALSDAPKNLPSESTPQLKAINLKQGAFRVWLASAGSEAEAAALWQNTRQQHPSLLARAEAFFSLVEMGGGQTLYRILAGPLASSAAALSLCQQLRVERPGAFCQVRPD